MRSFPWDSLVIGKDEQYGFPIIDRPSSAESLREVYKTFFSNGVFLNDRDAFQVTPSDGMNVIVAAGKCGIEGTIGWEESPRALAVQSSSDSADRIDTVVLRWNANISVRNIDLYVKTGVAQAVPVRPTLTRNETVWELGIADIFVAKGTGAISQARITDTRLQTERCGAVTPFATIDTTTFFNQIQAAIDERTGELEEQTQKAVDLAQKAIDETLAGNLQNQIDSNKAAIEKNSKDIKANSATDDTRWKALSEVKKATYNYGSGKVYVIKIGAVCNLRFYNIVVPAIAQFNDLLLLTLEREFWPSSHGNVLTAATVNNNGGRAYRVMLNSAGELRISAMDAAMASGAAFFSMTYLCE